MPLNDLPSFDSYPEGQLIPQEPETPKGRPRRLVFSPLQRVILGLAAVAFILGVVALFAPHYGNVDGIVRDIDGNPLRAQVFIAGTSETTLTDTHGRFVLTHIPSGQQVLTVKYGDSSYVFQIGIPQEDSLNIGQLQIVAGL